MKKISFNIRKDFGTINFNSMHGVRHLTKRLIKWNTILLLTFLYYLLIKHSCEFIWTHINKTSNLAKNVGYFLIFVDIVISLRVYEFIIGKLSKDENE